MLKETHLKRKEHRKLVRMRLKLQQLQSEHDLYFMKIQDKYVFGENAQFDMNKGIVREEVEDDRDI